MYNSLPVRIQCDKLRIFKRELKELYFKYDTIFLVALIDSIIILFCCVSHFCILFFLYLVFCFYIL